MEKKFARGRWILLASLVLCLGLSGAAWGGISGNSYHLRDVISGNGEYRQVAGPQWFAVVSKDWDNNGVPESWSTYGGLAPTSAANLRDKMQVYGELPSTFSSVYLKDHQSSPIKSVYLVTADDPGRLSLEFEHPSTTDTIEQDVKLSFPLSPIFSTPPSTLNPFLSDLTMGLSSAYGSYKGILNFRQENITYPYSPQAIQIPIVVAKVFNGLASVPGHELYFDMIIHDSRGDIETRRKFRWGAGGHGTRELGNFFMVLPSGTEPTYQLTTRITNRTGMPYHLQRYDMLDGVNQVEQRPDKTYWTYDVTPDRYGSLPPRFQLNSLSQVAPGLVTVYYDGLINMKYSTSASFRLYPFQTGSESDAGYKALTLSYVKRGGMIPYTGGTKNSARTISSNYYGDPASRPRWTITPFIKSFATGVPNDGRNTENDIRSHTGYAPEQLSESNFNSASFLEGIKDADGYDYISSSALSPVKIAVPVPPNVMNPDKTPLLPMRVRLRLSRYDNPLAGIWERLDTAENVIAALGNACTIWVRSPHTNELDMDLFDTLRNRGYSPEQCIDAFTYEDYLYLDFIVLMADAVSQTASKTAFCQVVVNERVPYILIGDGKQDGRWDLSFYAAPPEPVGHGSSSDDGGGGCAQGTGAWALLLLAGLPWALRGKSGKISA